MIIYCVTNTVNGKKYIGQTRYPLKHRWKQHCNDKRYKHHFAKAIKKYGSNCWNLEILESIDDISLLDEREIYWIDHFNTFRNGYNMTTGGGNGNIVSEEVRRKLSISNKGHEPPNKGKPMSEDQKKKLSMAHEGKTLTEETKMNMSKVRKGKPSHRKGKILPEKTKQKMREARVKYFQTRNMLSNHTYS